MNVSEAVARRRSIRAFTDKPVAFELLVDLLEKARRAPSGGNVQPWHAVLVTGAPLQALIARVQESIVAGAPSPEYDIYPADLPEPYRTRRSGCGEDMFASMGIPREDKAARMRHVMRNFSGWDAPVLLFCHTPSYMGKPQWSDLGMWLQTIMLLLQEAGVDSSPQEAWSTYGATIKPELGIPADHILFCGIAIGYADRQAPVNDTLTRRAALSETVAFMGL